MDDAIPADGKSVGDDRTAVLERIDALLEANPDAWIGALGRDAHYVPIPTDVQVGRHRLLRGSWALDHVLPEDRPVLAEAWRALRMSSVASTSARLTTGGTATFHLVRAVDVLGVEILLATSDDGDLDAAVAVAPSATTTRFCRVIRNAQGRIVDIDDAAPAVLGRTRDDLLSDVAPLDRVHPEDRGKVLEGWMAVLASPNEANRLRVRMLRPNGEYLWVEATSFNKLDDADDPHVVTEMLDISEEMAAHEAVAAREQLLHRLAEALPLGVLQIGQDRRIIYKNDELGVILGVEHATTLPEQFDAVIAEDRELVDKAFAVALDDRSDDDVVVRVAGPVERHVRVITKSLSDGGGVIACISDVTEATVMGRELERRATYDALTGCHNRATILARLASALSATDTSAGVAAIFLDLDGFKDVNDRLGHAAGDEMLKTMAGVLSAATRPSDAVGRLGGDEFLVVCLDVADATMALELANRISDAARGASLHTSIGVAWSQSGAVDADHLVNLADEAMYASKREGAGRPLLAG